jgi:hypothetical protein
MKNRKPTQIRIDGEWGLGPDNPGQYGRIYGSEIFHHVPHTLSSKFAYENKAAEFKA